MYLNNKTSFVRVIVLFLVVTLIFPIGANAASVEPMQPYASKYLSSYTAYVYLAGGGLVQVYFNVEGTGMMDELGALTIELYESTDKSTWKWVKTFDHLLDSGMLGYDNFYHSGHVDYQGVEGRYYKAYVCIWAGKDGTGDTRYFWTSVKPTT